MRDALAPASLKYRRSLRSLAMAAEVTAVSVWVMAIGVMPELQPRGAVSLPHVLSTAFVEIRRDSKYMHDCLASVLLSAKSTSAVALDGVRPAGAVPPSSTST